MKNRSLTVRALQRGFTILEIVIVFILLAGIMQSPTAKEEGRYRQITVNVQLTANIQALRKILDAVDAHTPFLFVDNLMIRSQVPGSFRPQPGQEPEMFVQFDVYGYTLPAQT